MKAKTFHPTNLTIRVPPSEDIEPLATVLFAIVLFLRVFLIKLAGKVISPLTAYFELSVSFRLQALKCGFVGLYNQSQTTRSFHQFLSSHPDKRH